MTNKTQKTNSVEQRFEAFEVVRSKIINQKWLSGKKAEEFLDSLLAGKLLQVNWGHFPSHRYTIYNSYDRWIRLTEYGFEESCISYGDGPSQDWHIISPDRALILIWNGLTRLKFID